MPNDIAKLRNEDDVLRLDMLRYPRCLLREYGLILRMARVILRIRHDHDLVGLCDSDGGCPKE